MAKQIIVGICAGIAAYKSAELVRLLCKQGDSVRVVMTKSALKFITPLTFEALSGHHVYTDLFDSQHESAMDHIELARWANHLFIAPATADFIAKLRCGSADDLLSTLCLATTAQLAIAPAMNHQMWNNPATQDNINILKQRGITLLGPDTGSQACGEIGAGRMVEVQQIVDHLHASCSAVGVLAGIRVLISAGPTREPIDPVRYISNHSSGKMGYALAQAANDAGAEVTLISGPVAISVPEVTQLIQVQTAQQMHDAVIDHIIHNNIYIASAAVADYTPKDVSSSKIKKSAKTMTVELRKTQDILRAVAASNSEVFSVGFAAETDHLEHYARSKLTDKKLNLIIANQVGLPDRGFDSDDNAVSVFWETGQQVFSLRSKKQLATDLIALIAKHYAKKSST
ncbi:MAG: bifunctional phosphopantothenoylcysteine decarboxylase/phosphopantothenate--cysteine ligase CoaBC [Methylococcales bacterium]